MKKWAIWHKEDNKVVHIYDSEEPIQFGGPWGNQICCHHELDQSLWNVPMHNLELRSANIQVGTQRVPKLDAQGNQIMEVARHQNDEPILDSNGDEILLPVYKTVPVMQAQMKILKKIGT